MTGIEIKEERKIMLSNIAIDAFRKACQHSSQTLKGMTLTFWDGFRDNDGENVINSKTTIHVTEVSDTELRYHVV